MQCHDRYHWYLFWNSKFEVIRSLHFLASQAILYILLSDQLTAKIPSSLSITFMRSSHSDESFDVPSHRLLEVFVGISIVISKKAIKMKYYRENIFLMLFWKTYEKNIFISKKISSFLGGFFYYNFIILIQSQYYCDDKKTKGPKTFL